MVKVGEDLKDFPMFDFKWTRTYIVISFPSQLRLGSKCLGPFPNHLFWLYKPTLNLTSIKTILRELNLRRYSLNAISQIVMFNQFRGDLCILKE